MPAWPGSGAMEECSAWSAIRDPLCRAVLEESNRDETGRWDGGGLFSHQVRGFGLGVMQARAMYYARKEPRFAAFLTEGRTYGPPRSRSGGGQLHRTLR